MNTGPLAGDWLRLVAVLGLEPGLVAMVFALVQRFCVSAVWRRLLWRAALMGTVVVLVCELGGAGQWMAHWLLNDANQSKAVTIVSSNLEPSPELNVPQRGTLEPAVPVIEHPPSTRVDSADTSSVVWWPAWLWLAGTGVLLGRLLLARLVFAVGLRRRGRFCDAQVGGRAVELGDMLGLRRPVRLSELNDLPAPISYGVFRPGIVLPAHFVSDNDNASRDAMLLHELAHVSARDGLWHAVGDLVAACLWWHPAVWWMRREMEFSCEMAADEASVVVDNGPRVLAECLVTMARRLAAPAGLGWQGIQGSRFRSRVGRRVERLLGLQPTLRLQTNGLWRWAGRTAVALLLAGIILAGAFIGHERTTRTASWREHWSGSLGAMVLSQIAAAEPKPVQGIDWIVWSRDALAEARAQGRPVLVYFTADWAISAKVNERNVLESPAVRERLAALNVAMVKGDRTTPDDPSIETELKSFGNGTVPLTLVYSSDPTQAPEVLPEALTPAIVLAALERVQAVSARLTSKAENAVQPGPASTPQQVSTMLFEGKASYDAGRLDEAKAKLRDALKADPNNQAARHFLSRIDEMQRPATPNSPTLQTRMFKIDKVAFAEGLIRRFPRAASETNVLTTKAVYERFSRYLKESGIEDRPNSFQVPGPLHGPKPARPESAIAPESEFLPRMGPVIPEKFRWEYIGRQGTEPELDRVEQAIHTLSGPLPQVLIEARLCEVPEEAWSLLQSNADVHLTPGHAVGGNNGGSNAIAQTCVLPPQQFAALEVGLREQSGVNVLSAPRVTTLSHRQAQIKIVDVRSVVTHLVPAMELSDATRGTGAGRGGVGGAGGGQGGQGGQGGVGGQGGKGGQGGGKGGVGQGGAGGKGGVGGAGGQRGGQGGQGGAGGGQGGKGGQGGQGGQGGVGGQGGGAGGQGGGGGGQGGRGGGGGGGRGGGRSNLVPIAEEFESGPVLDVIPYVRPDGVTIDLTVIATVKEFIGYDLDSPKFIDGGVSPRPADVSHSPSVPPIIGAELSREKARFPVQQSTPTQTTPKPIYRLRQMVAPIRISDGQTAVLAGGEDKLDLVRSKAASAPLLSDLPVIGRLFRDEHAKLQKTKLVVLVTARIIDPAGNPIRSTEEISSETPVQPERRLN